MREGGGGWGAKKFWAASHSAHPDPGTYVVVPEIQIPEPGSRSRITEPRGSPRIPKPCSATIADIHCRRYPLQTPRAPTTQTTLDKRKCGTGIIFFEY